jgi:hypothetical protein
MTTDERARGILLMRETMQKALGELHVTVAEAARAFDDATRSIDGFSKVMADLCVRWMDSPRGRAALKRIRGEARYEKQQARRRKGKGATWNVAARSAASPRAPEAGTAAPVTPATSASTAPGTSTSPPTPDARRTPAPTRTSSSVEESSSLSPAVTAGDGAKPITPTTETPGSSSGFAARTTSRSTRLDRFLAHIERTKAKPHPISKHGVNVQGLPIVQRELDTLLARQGIPLTEAEEQVARMTSLPLPAFEPPPTEQRRIVDLDGQKVRVADLDEACPVHKVTPQ